MRADLKKTTGYIVDVVTRESLEFQYNPDEITDEKSTDFATIKVPGMSHPRYQYVAGEARRIAFKISFFKGPVQGEGRVAAVTPLPAAREDDAQERAAQGPFLLRRSVSRHALRCAAGQDSLLPHVRQGQPSPAARGGGVDA